MSRSGDIRWRKTDKASITKAINNYNAKINRLEKRGYDPDLLPQKVHKKELMFEITNRSDFKKQLGSLKDFTKRGAETIIKNDRGVKSTRYEISEIEKNIKEINRLRRQERKKKDIQDIPENAMGTMLENAYAPKSFDINKSRSRDELKDYAERAKYQATTNYYAEKDQQAKENYLKAIEKTFGKDNDLYKKVMEMGSDLIVKNFYKDERLQISFVYEPQKQADLYNMILDQLNEIAPDSDFFDPDDDL